MGNDMFGEVKARKNIFPAQAREIVKKGTVDILLIQAIATPKTKEILKGGGVTLYEGIEPNEVNQILEKLAKESEKKERGQGDL